MLLLTNIEYSILTLRKEYSLKEIADMFCKTKREIKKMLKSALKKGVKLC